MAVWVREKQKGSGEWWVFIKHAGKRRSKKVGDKKSANALAKEVRNALAAGDLGLGQEEEEPQGPTFNVYSEQYLDRAEPDGEHGLKRSSWLDYASCIRRNLQPALGDRPLEDIHRRDVKDLAISLRASGLSAINVRKHMRILSAVLSEAVEDELIPANPALGLRKLNRSKLKGSQRKAIDPLDEGELAHVLATAKSHTERRRGKQAHPFRRYFPFLLLLAHTGLRLGEAFALKWGDLDWRGGFLQVRRAYVRGEMSVPKSGKERRVYVTRELLDALRDLYCERFGQVVPIDAGAREARHGEALDKWMFPDDAGGLMDESNLRRRVWGPLLAAAGVRHVRLHDLRHGYASLLLAKGKPLKFVQAQLGHHSAAFTLSVYGHLLRGDHEGLVDLGGSPKVTQRSPGAELDELTQTPETTKALA
jgi:integrase